MHRVIAERVRVDPALVDRARARLEALRSSGAIHVEYLEAWARLLAAPRDQLCEALVDPGERSCALRQVSPFAGVLSARERWRILQSVA